MSFSPSGQPFDPKDLQPDIRTRVLRCPRCRQAFETARRFSLTCPYCNHTWEEASNRTRADRIADLQSELFERAIWYGMWGGVAVIVLVLLAGIAYFMIKSWDRLGPWDTALVGAIILLIGGMFVLRLTHWRPGR